MTDHFEGLRIPPNILNTRRDVKWERDEQGKEHRVRVLRALQEAMHEVQVARALHRGDTGEDPNDDDDFQQAFWSPIWNGLRASLTRQDLLRWLMDWAAHSTRERAVGTVVRMHEELEMLDDESGAWWLTQNPG